MVKAAFGGIVDVICTFDPHKLYNHSGTKFQFWMETGKMYNLTRQMYIFRHRYQVRFC